MPVHYSRMMSSENASNKIVQSLIDLVNMAKWLMDENQQLSVTQELGRLLPSIRGRGRRGESSDLVHVISQVWSSTTVVSSFPNKTWVILSHFSLVQKEYKYFELVLLRQMCQRKHVLNYASKNCPGTK